MWVNYDSSTNEILGWYRNGSVVPSVEIDKLVWQEAIRYGHNRVDPATKTTDFHDFRDSSEVDADLKNKMNYQARLTLRIASIFTDDTFDITEITTITDSRGEAKDYLDGVSSTYSMSAEFKNLANKYWYGI